jgi:fumarate reductase flavoprotein subunit
MKQLEADVVIISAGTAGLAAAVAAAERGAKVIAFEKASTTGGTGNMGMGPLGVESRLQRQKRMALTREEAFKIFMDYTHWRVDARLVKAYLYKSGSTIDWLEQMGVEFSEPEAYFPGSNFTWHTVKSGPSGSTPGASAIMMKKMTERAQRLGVQFHLQTPVKKILKEGGQIVGVMAEDSSGEDIQAKAKAVIVATGGFGDNPEWIKKFTGYEYGRDLFSMRVPGLVGEGIRMAWEAGAAPGPMNMELIYNPIEEGEIELHLAFRQPNLLVNLLGERFINEGIMGNNTFTGNAIAIQKNRCAFVIFDEAAKEHYKKVGLDQCWGGNPLTKLENIDAAIKQTLAQGNKSLIVADSLEELASKTGININGLRKTVAEYNQACEKGRDDLFNKDYRYLKPVKQPRFYAGKLVCSAYGSLGGIKINDKTEVLTKDYEVIPGLYAAGTDACAIYGDSYVFVLPGNTMGFALNSGRLAGENAAEYAKSTAK